MSLVLGSIRFSVGLLVDTGLCLLKVFSSLPDIGDVGFGVHMKLAKLCGFRWIL